MSSRLRKSKLDTTMLPLVILFSLINWSRFEIGIDISPEREKKCPYRIHPLFFLLQF